jgi:hypothetical protein
MLSAPCERSAKFAPFVPFDFSAGGFDASLATYFDRAEAWGFDVLRVPFSWAAPGAASANTASIGMHDRLHLRARPADRIGDT